MVEHDVLSATREAYDAAALTYAQLFSDSLRDSPLDRAILGAFVEVVSASGDGQVADLGCGPGYITAYLDELGLAAFGVDASPAMIELARQTYPGLRFDVGSMAALNIADGVLGGVLSRWSIIHTPPRELPAILAEFHRVLAPGGHLLIGFSEAMIRLTRRRSSITRSRRPIGGGLITSPRCCASPGCRRWPGWFASLSPPIGGSSRRFKCSPAKPRQGLSDRTRDRTQPAGRRAVKLRASTRDQDSPPVRASDEVTCIPFASHSKDHAMAVLISRRRAHYLGKPVHHLRGRNPGRRRRRRRPAGKAVVTAAPSWYEGRSTGEGRRTTWTRSGTRDRRRTDRGGRPWWAR